MNEILRDRDAVSIRLVMTPDRMVIAEAMRTFTYLSLYGYLTDAVVVNRVFPEEVEGGYFGAWREVQREQLELVESGFAPVPVLRAPYFEQEVLGAAMLDRLGDALFDGADAGGVLHDKLAQELSLDEDGAQPAARHPVRRQGRHLAQEDRPRADRPRRRPEAHDHAAARARPLPAVVGVVLRRVAAGELQWLSTIPLSQMRSQVDAAYAAADRLVREAEAAARERAADVPPAGFEGERTQARALRLPRHRRRSPGLLEAARTSLPPELAHQLAAAARELLIALRALIDWWIARLERERERAASRSRTSRSIRPDPRAA